MLVGAAKLKAGLEVAGSAGERGPDGKVGVEAGGDKSIGVGPESALALGVLIAKLKGDLMGELSGCDAGVAD